MTDLALQHGDTSTGLSAGLTALDEAARHAPLDELGRGLSISSPEVALRRPLADLVEATLDAAANSEHTRRSYTTAIGLFLQWLDEARGPLVPEHLAEVWRPFAVATTEGKRTEWRFDGTPAAVLRLADAAGLDAFRAWRVSEGDSPNTAQIRLYAVRTFLSVALRDNVLTREQAQNMSLAPYQPRHSRKEKTVGRRLTKKEVRTLRATVDASTNKGKRDLAILDLMLYAGMRRSEVANLTTDHLRRDQGRWWLVFAGKGEKERRIKLHDVIFQSLSAWSKTSGIGWEVDNQPLFVSVDRWDNIQGSQIDPSQVTRLVAEYGHLAGLAPASGSGVLSPHDLRRTCARNAYDNGAPLPKIQALLGHADIKTTMRYIGADEDESDTATDYVRY